MRSQIKSLLWSIASTIVPVSIWQRLIDVDLLLPHWHIVNNFFVAHVNGLYQFRTCSQFKKDIDFFLKRYSPISLNQIINYLDGKEKLPKRCFMPSFDDGFRQNYEIIAPILLEKGVPASFFLTTSTIDNKELCYPQKKSLILYKLSKSNKPAVKDRILNLLCSENVCRDDIVSKIRTIYYHKRHLLDQIGDILEIDFHSYCQSVKPYLNSTQINSLLKQGFEIGAHSIDHPNYLELTIEEQLKQTEGSIDFLSKNFGFSCRSFAFPYTDVGISDEFLTKAFQNMALKVTFGYGLVGNHQGTHPRNLKRFSMEGTNWSARQHLIREFGKVILKK